MELKICIAVIVGIFIGVFCNDLDLERECKTKGEFNPVFTQKIKCEVT